nr:MAG TPA: hypothetical protein [Caudoviricetes sp.]
MLHGLTLLEDTIVETPDSDDEFDVFSETTLDEAFNDTATKLLSECQTNLNAYFRYQDHISLLNTCKDLLPANNTYILDFMEKSLKYEQLFISKDQLHQAGIESVITDILDKAKNLLSIVKEKFKDLYENIANTLRQMTLTVSDCVHDLNNAEDKERSELGYKTVKVISPSVLGRYFSAIENIKTKTSTLSNIFNYNQRTGEFDVRPIESIFGSELNAIGFKSEFGKLSIDHGSPLRKKQEFQLSTINRQDLIKIGTGLLQNHKNVDILVKNFDAIFSKFPDFKTETLDPDTGDATITSINMNIRKLYSNLVKLAQDIFKQSKFITKDYIKLCKVWLS